MPRWLTALIVTLLAAVTWLGWDTFSTQKTDDQIAEIAVLQQELDRLMVEQEALQSETLQAQSNADQATMALGDSVMAAKAVSEKIAGLSDRIETLTQENESLRFESEKQQRAASAAADQLSAEIGRLERIAQSDREAWEETKGRLAAANENLGKQNAILKDRLAGVLKESIELPEGSNADAALARGSMEIEALENQVDELERQLAEAGRQRNTLARSLLDARSAGEGAAMVASLSSGAGDRIVTDLSERVDALKKEVALSKTILNEKQALWDAEKSRLLNERNALQAKIGDLQTRLSSISERPAVEEPTTQPTASLSPAASTDHAFAALPLPISPRLIDDPKNLSAETSRLFSELSALSDSPAGLKAAYDDLKTSLEATPVLTIPFRASSAELDQSFSDAIAALPTEARRAGRYLIIGYASNDGNEMTNRDLSSRRAMAVAESVAAHHAEVPIEAVYFGQTSRFDSRHRSANRVVEIWQIK